MDLPDRDTHLLQPSILEHRSMASLLMVRIESKGGPAWVSSVDESSQEWLWRVCSVARQAAKQSHSVGRLLGRWPTASFGGEFW